MKIGKNTVWIGILLSLAWNVAKAQTRTPQQYIHEDLLPQATKVAKDGPMARSACDNSLGCMHEINRQERVSLESVQVAALTNASDWVAEQVAAATDGSYSLSGKPRLELSPISNSGRVSATLILHVTSKDLNQFKNANIKLRLLCENAQELAWMLSPPMNSQDMVLGRTTPEIQAAIVAAIQGIDTDQGSTLDFKPKP